MFVIDKLVKVSYLIDMNDIICEGNLIFCKVVEEVIFLFFEKEEIFGEKMM